MAELRPGQYHSRAGIFDAALRAAESAGEAAEELLPAADEFDPENSLRRALAFGAASQAYSALLAVAKPGDFETD